MLKPAQRVLSPRVRVDAEGVTPIDIAAEAQAFNRG
jgi:hypothetical protein